MQIDKNFCDAGKWNTLSEEPSGGGKAPMVRGTKAMRDLADDLAALTPAVIASADAVVAAGANPTKAEFDAVVALVNEIKAALNAISAGALLTTKVD